MANYNAQLKFLDYEAVKADARSGTLSSQVKVMEHQSVNTEMDQTLTITKIGKENQGAQANDDSYGGKAHHVRVPPLNVKNPNTV